MKLIFYLLVLFLITNATTCTRISLPNTKWKVLEVRLPNATSTQMPTKDYVLEFKADSSITIKLDINNCFSKYKTTNKKNITVNPFACTKACCDSEFAQNLIYMLAKMETYQIKGKALMVGKDGESNILLLEGDGKIKLELVK